MNIGHELSVIENINCSDLGDQYNGFLCHPDANPTVLPIPTRLSLPPKVSSTVSSLWYKWLCSPLGTTDVTSSISRVQLRNVICPYIPCVSIYGVCYVSWESCLFEWFTLSCSACYPVNLDHDLWIQLFNSWKNCGVINIMFTSLSFLAWWKFLLTFVTAETSTMVTPVAMVKMGKWMFDSRMHHPYGFWVTVLISCSVFIVQRAGLMRLQQDSVMWWSVPFTCAWLYMSFLLFCLICIYSSQFSILFRIMYLL